jgi:hypothetical protein
MNGLTLILVYAQCRDVRSLWDPVGHPSVCWSPLAQADFGFFQGCKFFLALLPLLNTVDGFLGVAMNAATDLFLTVLPATILWSAQINLKLKLGLGFLLGLSVLSVFPQTLGHILRIVSVLSLGS